MLSATSTRPFGQSLLRSTIFLERRFRTHVVVRDQLLFDSLHAPAAKKGSPFVHLYAQLRGSFQIDSGPITTGRQVYVVAETEFERRTPGARTFRSWGNPAVVVEMRVPASDLRLPVGLEHGQVTFPEAVWAAYEALEASPTEASLHQLIKRLGEARILSSDLTQSVVASEPERFLRLWDVIRPLYEDLATSASLKQIAIIARLSLRQLGRDLGDLTRTFGLFGAGFRDAMRVLRLRAAVLLLSSPGATPSEVAKAVGYGSLDAMGRAFRDAQLPAPSIVQDAVRYPGSPAE